MAVGVAGSAIGPWIFSVVYKFTGSYSFVGVIGLILTAISLAFILKGNWYVESE